MYICTSHLSSQTSSWSWFSSHTHTLIKLYWLLFAALPIQMAGNHWTWTPYQEIAHHLILSQDSCELATSLILVHMIGLWFLFAVLSAGKSLVSGFGFSRLPVGCLLIPHKQKCSTCRLHNDRLPVDTQTKLQALVWRKGHSVLQAKKCLTLSSPTAWAKNIWIKHFLDQNHLM